MGQIIFGESAGGIRNDLLHSIILLVEFDKYLSISEESRLLVARRFHHHHAHQPDPEKPITGPRDVAVESPRHYVG